LSPWELGLLSVIVAALTFAGEAVGIGIAFGVSPTRVLVTAFDFDAGIRPGWQVLGAGLATVILDVVRARWNGRATRSRPVPAE
jgi:sulfoxide reductase heme-binding subunit YedZ